MKHLLTWILAGTTLGLAGIVVRNLQPGGATSPSGPGAPAVELPFGAVTPIPEAYGLDAHKVALGDRLFHDVRLSGDSTISCASCHDLSRGGADGLRYSKGMGGQVGELNAPTVLNSRYQFSLFWDGRAATLEEQVDGPLHHPGEMGSDWNEVLDRIAADPHYVQGFTRSYGDGVTAENVKNAIAEFERSLVTPDAPFDRYLRGDEDALSEEQRAGWGLFRELGCITCHQGVNLGGNSFQALSVNGQYFADRGDEVRPSDMGRYNVTGLERDRYRFKVPTLRNVALTAPYLHDGTATTLDEVVRIMARYQLGIELTDEEAGALVAFLQALTGTLRRRL